MGMSGQTFLSLVSLCLFTAVNIISLSFSYDTPILLPLVMTTLRKVSDFISFLPFLFSLYHHPEPSGTFYADPHTTVMTHTLERSSMT